MFFIVALIATIAYATQGTLMASYYRSMDQLSAVAYRGLSLGVSMIPLLLFVPSGEFAHVPSFAGSIVVAAVCAALGNLYIARAFCDLPIGIATGMAMSCAAILTGVLGFVLLGEVLTSHQIFFSALILVTLTMLGMTRSGGTIPTNYNIRKGIVNCLLFGVFLGSAYSFVGMTSRSLHPFLVGYLWEFTIGIIAALMAVSRTFVGGPSLTIPKKRDLLKITLYSSPTAIGTGLYALSMTMGPIGIATAIISTMMLFNTVFAAFLYGEKLSVKQWALLVLVCGAVIGLKLSSPSSP